MKTANLLKVKSSFSGLIDAIEHGHEKEIIITRHGKPAAKLVSLNNLSSGQRIGVAEEKFIVPDSIDCDNDKIAQLFLGK
jgi:prevent-host-death family protein